MRFDDHSLPPDIDDSSTHDDSGPPIDSVTPAFPDDPGLRMDSADTNSEDFGTATDDMESLMSRCINCGADVRDRRRHGLNLIEVQLVIRRWIAPRTVSYILLKIFYFLLKQRFPLEGYTYTHNNTSTYVVNIILIILG